MTFRSTILAAAAAFAFAAPAFSDGAIAVQDAYARSSTPQSKSGAAFMVLENHGDTDDRLIAVSSDIAERTELHTHKENADGVMQMLKIDDGFVVPAGGQHALQRGGDHVMFMGLKAPLEQGVMVPLTLTFEKAGEVAIELPVDLDR